MRESEKSRKEFLEALLNEIEDAIIILDEEFKVRFSNRAARHLFPSEQSQVGRQLIEVCLDHRIVDTVSLSIEIGGRTQEQITKRGQVKEGRVDRTYLVESEPLSSRGIGNGAWILIRDITMKLETERIRQDFVANASHELRTPLSIINGYLEMFDGGEAFDSETAKRCIATMRKHGERLSRIVEDMLAISKLETTADMLNWERFDWADCIYDSLEHLHPLIEGNGARIKVDLPEEREFFGDRYYWDQIFFNLIENALKENPGGKLKITIRVISDEGRYRIEVSDNGLGIPSADVPHVFKRFYRVQKDHSKIVKGTGLGLSIVKRAVEAHHGRIELRSIPGRETTFTITVPKPTKQMAQKAEAN
jgi:PAS domain S-box-containing protein